MKKGDLIMFQYSFEVDQFEITILAAEVTVRVGT